MANTAHKPTFSPTVADVEHTIGPWVFRLRVKAEIDNRTGELVHPGREVMKASRAIVRELATRGASDGAAFAYMRKAAKLSGKALAELLGVAPETVSRWEHDKEPINRAALAVVGQIALEAIEGRSTTLERLRAAREVKAGSVAIDLAGIDDG